MARKVPSETATRFARTNARLLRARPATTANTRMMPSSVKAMTGRRSSQRSRSAAWGGAAGASPSIDLIIGRVRRSAGEAVADSIAVGQAQRRADFQAQALKDDLRLQKIALHLGCGPTRRVVHRGSIHHDS